MNTVEKKELMNQVELQIDEVLTKDGFLKRKGDYYKPLPNRFLGTLSFTRSHFNSPTDFWLDVILIVENMNTACVSNWLKKKTKKEYIPGGAVTIDNVCNLLPKVKPFDWGFSTTSKKNKKVLEKALKDILPVSNRIFKQIDSPDKFTTYLMENSIMNKEGEIMLQYYCCNRKDLAMRYLDMIRQGKISKNALKNPYFADFCEMFETLLPEDPQEILCEVPAYCKKRRITYID